VEGFKPRSAAVTMFLSLLLNGIAGRAPMCSQEKGRKMQLFTQKYNTKQEPELLEHENKSGNTVGYV
jgi:hypothetical protein